jgi:effector-binding domain-containing protein
MTVFPENPFGIMDRIDIGEVPLAVIRHEGITIDDLRDAFDRGYAAIGELFAEGVLTPAGPALAVYDGNPMERFDLELGFPVAQVPTAPIASSGGLVITASALPPGPATATTTFGPYDGLSDAWRGLYERTVSEDLAPRGISVEIYVSDPSTSTEDLRTDLILPVH